MSKSSKHHHLEHPEHSHGRHGHDHDHDSCGHSCHQPLPPTKIKHCRHLYLKIEKLPAYSPVAPDDAEHERYRRDCMRNEGHEDTHIPPSEVERRRLDAVVYREYLDSGYTIPNTDPLVSADINEPRWDRRIPGALIYAEPGERLFIHVCNADDVPHSLHVHGLIYGIDSDGSWPFGVANASGRRSDAICPGQTWCYVFDVTEETVGAWPFHDHHMHIEEQVNRGLFGGIVVRDKRCPKPDYEVPLFFHRLVGSRPDAAFDSGTLNPGAAAFNHTFAVEGTYDYYCRFHPMTGIVRVTAGGLATAAVTILDGPSRFEPADVTISPGGTVTWTYAAALPHTVTDAGGSALDSYALNGRAFVGNSPTIVAKSGKRIRWYVFDLDLSTQWHNFHVHGQPWRVGDEAMDTRTLGPAESFVADTIVPPVVLLPLDDDCAAHAEHRTEDDADCGCRSAVGRHAIHLPRRPGAGPGAHGHDAPAHDVPRHGIPTHGAVAHHAGGPTRLPHRGGTSEKPHKDKDHRVTIQGDFLVHCHAEMHMMQGMAAIVRAIQEIELTPELEAALGFDLPLENPEPCSDVPIHPCRHGSEGSWEVLPDSPIFVVHAALLHTGKVLLWSGTAEMGYPLESRVWDPGAGTMTLQTYGEDLFCSGHAFLPDGTLCIAGGAPQGILRSTHLFDPVAEAWTKVADMAEDRWYPTVLTLPDGRILAASGSGATSIEIYDPGADAWQTVAGAARSFPELYPGLHVLPSGPAFYTRVGWAQADMLATATAYLTLTGPLSGMWASLGTQQFFDRQEGASVLQIDDTVTPPAAHVYVAGGGAYGPPASRNPLSVERIDLTTLGPGAAWARVADMNFPRTNINVVLLPDGTLLAVGGQQNGKWASDPGAVLEAEIYDPATDTWMPTAPMTYPRQYHSIAALLPDGRVLTAGGVDPRPGITPRDQLHMELFSPPYLSFGTPPAIVAAPATVGYGATFDVDTPDASRIQTAALLRPASVTHHTDAGMRYVRIPILGRTASDVTLRAPSTASVAPPGYYMLFLVDMDGVPSVARFIRVG